MSRLVGNAAPDFKAQALVDGDFKEISLGDFGGKWKILFFYPLDFTFVCPTEIIAFSDAADKFREKNCEIIACSIDSVFSHLAWSQQARNEGGIGEVNFAPRIEPVAGQLPEFFELRLNRTVQVSVEIAFYERRQVSSLNLGRKDVAGRHWFADLRNRPQLSVTQFQEQFFDSYIVR